MLQQTHLLQDADRGLRMPLFFRLPVSPPGRIPGMFAALSFDRQQHVVKHGHFEIQRRLLIPAGDAPPKDLIRRIAADVVAIKHDSAS